MWQGLTKIKTLFDTDEEPQQQAQQQVQQQVQTQQQPKIITENDMKIQDIIIEERDKELREIANDMIHVNEMMQTMGSLVDQQGDFVDSIRSNITKADEYVESGKKDLEQAEENQKTEGKLAMIMLMITTTIVATSGAVVAFFVS